MVVTRQKLIGYVEAIMTEEELKEEAEDAFDEEDH
jgi:hypothetical protein